MDPQEAFEKFIEKISGDNLTRYTALAFFVGYSYGATGARENIDALIAAMKAMETKP